jgi:CheY-like chemotaxis protein
MPVTDLLRSASFSMKRSLTVSRMGTPHILLVDDNRNGLIVRRALLEEVGFTVETAATGEDGFALFEAAHFDVVVTDYRMPRMNGVELIQKIRKHNPNARIVLLSGFVEALGLTEQSTGADLIVAKNAKEATQLIRSVKRLLSQATTRKPPASQPAAVAARARATAR